MRLLPWILVLVSLAAFPAAAKDLRWSRVTGPLPGAAEVIGKTSHGCLTGAVALPAQGKGYQVLRRARNRYWGHPELIAFITDLGHRFAASDGRQMLVGDLAQPRGGPMSYGHASHETGLDVDIWFRLPDRPLAAAALAKPTPVNLVASDWKNINTNAFEPAHATMVRLAAQDPRVDRIFVNPVIKRELCRTATGDRAWLGKLRPWWGHNEHFHVRLTCPAGSPDCVPQNPVPPGDGCGDSLAWWFSAEAEAAARERYAPKPQGKPTPPPPLPARCAGVLAGAG